MIEVCCAIIVKESKILAVQRGLESSHPMEWEFPGGKIQACETAEQCIVREITEELTVSIEVLTKLAPVEFDYGSKQIRLIPFICRIVSGEIYLTEHVAQQWIDFEGWIAINWSGADRELILKNQERLKLMMLDIR
jgi:8-oxo-dGTP diphosphatase